MNKKERLKSILAKLNVSEGDFEKNTGLAKGAVSNFGENPRTTTLDKIKNIYPEINITWLLTEEGEMFIDSNPKQESILPEQEDVPSDATYKLVPVIHVDSVGGMHSNNDVVGEPQYIEGYVPFVNARDDDRAIYQSGDSMIPTIPPGSLMQIREVKNWREYFGYGNIFVIELTDGRRITKEVARYNENAKEYVWCVSHNPNVADEELPRDMIVSVWKVIKILTNKGW